MQIDVSEMNGATIVKPVSTRLDLQVAAEFRTVLLQLIEAGSRHVVVDLSEVQFIDSSGLGALVSALKTLKLLKGTGEIRLANVQPPVISLMEIVRLQLRA
jgi:anti-sigma B factor antagonist